MLDKNNTKKNSQTIIPREPTLIEALISLVSLITGIGVSIAFYGLDPHVPMLLGAIIASLIAFKCGYSWIAVQKAMVNGISQTLPTVMILILIGLLIGVWVLAGVVPTLIYYGLQFLSPTYFLPTTLIICAVASLATGSSWGTTGTIGIALMSIGGSLGFPTPIVAGAVLSGAYFGDKISPLSDTTNLAASMAGTELYAHIRHMLNTSSVAFGLTLVIEIVLNKYYANNTVDLVQIDTIMTSLQDNFLISPILLLPVIVLMVSSYKRVPALPGIVLGLFSAIVVGVLLQGNTYEQIVSVSFAGFSSETNNPAVDELLSRGGMESMLYTISLVIVAMMFSGIMDQTGQLKVIIKRVLDRINSSRSLIVTSSLTTIVSNLILCEQYMSVVMGARSYSQAYKDQGLHSKNLSRVVEDCGTVTANLVPWSSGGAYQAGVLGVATLAYLPFAFFCWISPLVSIIYGLLNINIVKIEDDPDTQL